jgi:pilus assembly protein CpaF
MDIDELHIKLREQVSLSHGMDQAMTRESVAGVVQQFLGRLPRDVRRNLSDRDLAVLVNRVADDLMGFGPLQALMDDAEVTEVMVNAPHRVYVERQGHKTLSNVRFIDEAHVRMVVERMMGPSGRRLDESVPFCDFSLNDGSRVHVIIPPLAVGGPKVTIRKFLDTIENVEDLLGFGTLDRRMADFLIACMRGKRNLLFSGATGCGKTTTLAALSYYIDPQERIVTIEDTLELNLRQQHVVSLLTRPPNIEGKGEVSLRDLLRNSLRMRPSRILLGEIRGGEALDYLQALNSGHRGCSAVMHASAPPDAVHRLETMALYAGLDLPVHAIRQQIASGLDLIIQQDQLHDGSRRITHITEVNGIQDQAVVLQDLFRFELEGTEADGTVRGRFLALAPPRDLDLFRRQGLDLPDRLFEEA